MVLLQWVALCFIVCSALSLPVRRDEYFRLDHKIEPINYDIELTFTDLNSVSGKVTIEAKITDQWVEESTINIHIGENIDYDSAQVNVFHDGNDFDWCKDKSQHIHHKDTEIWEIPLVFGAEFTEGDIVTIIVMYDLKSTEANGIHKYSYFVDEETSESILATHFQPTHARNVFPCFDEPSFQATFQLSLTLPAGYSALSNTIESSLEDLTRANKIIDNEVKFMKTPRMSTFMLGFVIYHDDTYGTFSDTTRISEDIIFETFARKSYLEGTIDVGKEYGAKIVQEMELYTQIAYDGEEIGGTKAKAMVSKHDQVAVPNYSLEPMETYGLATYHESALLVEEGYSEVAMERAIETIAYGVAHHWFGDLVTAEWWDTAWLNEGFSTFFDYYLSESAMGEDWRMQERLVVVEQTKALEADATLDTLPLTSPVSSNEDVLKQFGIIASSKGASVLRMFEKAVGSDIFAKAVQEYLKENIGSISNPRMFFEKLNEKSSIKIEFFEDWTTSKGFPLITITKEQKTEGGVTTHGIQINQERFVLGEDSDEKTVYELILSVQTNAENVPQLGSPLHFNEKETFVAADILESSWILVKSDGYYRVNYEDDNWNLLAQHFQDQLSGSPALGKAIEKEIEPLERAVLVNNALYLSQEGIIDYTVALDFVSYLQGEDDYIPWTAALPGLDFLHRMLAKVDDESYNIDAFITTIADHTYMELQEQNLNGHIDKILYSHIQHLSCRSGHKSCVKSAEEIFSQYVDGQVEVDQDLRSTVFCYGVQNNEEHWQYLWEKYIGKTSARGNLAENQERSRYISALGCSSSQEKLLMYLEGTIPELPGDDETLIPREEVTDVFLSVFANVHGRQVALNTVWEFIKTLKEYGAVETIISGMAKYLKTEEEKSMVESLRERGNIADEVIDAAIDIVEKNIKWVDENEDAVNEAIKNVLLSKQTTTTEPSTDSSSTTITPEPSTDSSSTTITPEPSTASSSTIITTGPPTDSSSTIITPEPSTDSSSITTDDGGNQSTPDGTTTKKPGGSAWNLRPATFLIFLSGSITIILFG